MFRASRSSTKASLHLMRWLLVIIFIAIFTASATAGDGKVRAQLNGRVVAVLVKPGEAIAAGQPVVTLEAMKMEHVHRSAIAGRVTAIDVAEGEQVTTGRVVVEIEIAAG